MTSLTISIFKRSKCFTQTHGLLSDADRLHNEGGGEMLSFDLQGWRSRHQGAGKSDQVAYPLNREGKQKAGPT